MTSSTHLPAIKALHDVADVLTAYRTCELATLTRGGTAVTWPAVCWLDPSAGQLVLTTSIALPRKAFNIRRDPHVALLFSDPTGTGSTDLPQLLVQGTARCPDEIRTSPQGLEEYWRQLWQRQPSSAGYGSNALSRRLFDFYYMRLVITVTPDTVITRPPLQRTAPLPAPRPGRREQGPFATAVRRLPGYADAVLATVTGGAPTLRRVRPVADPATGALVLEGADPAEVTGVPTANLLFHGHDDRINHLRQLGLVGELSTASDRVVLRPTRILGAPVANNPLALVRTVRELRQATQRYLDRRGLDRPSVPWAEYRALL